MTEPTCQLITRKEIAHLIGVSVRQVRKFEKKWGLDSARTTLGTTPILYRRKAVLVILERHRALN